MRRASEGGVWWASPIVASVLSIAPAVLAIFLQVHQLTLHDALKGVTFSADGTNLGSALLLSAGRLPYDNFVLAQPPGMSILMLPFAWAAHATSTGGALSAARAFTAAVAVANVFMVGLVTRRRGFAASLIAGVTFAIYPLAFEATGSVLFEPYLLFFCLLALLMAFPQGELAGGRRLVIAGVLLGFAITIKPWAVVPAAAVLICSGLEWRMALRRFGSGLLAGVVVPSIFFLLAAPGQFWTDVVVAELRGGSSAHPASISSRMAQLLGLGAPAGISGGGTLAVAIVLALVAGAVVLTVARLRLTTTLDWVILMVAAVLFLLTLVPSSVPLAYGYFAVAFAASVFGTMLGNLLSWLSGLAVESSVGASAAAGLSVLSVAVAIALIALAVPTETSYASSWYLRHGFDPTAEVTRIVPVGGCVISDDPSILIVSGRLLGEPSGCPAVIDPVGVVAAAGPPGRATAAALDQTWATWFSASQFAVLNAGSSEIPWGPVSRAQFRRVFALAASGRADVFTTTVASVG